MSPEAKAHKRAHDAERYRRLRDARDAERGPDLIETLPETVIAYLAGLTDGDGSIFVTHTNRLRTYYPTVVWAMTDRRTIDQVREWLGGTTTQLNNHTNLRTGVTSWGASKFKQQWKTTVSGTRAKMLCKRMLPYLITKRGQAELVAIFPTDERRAPGRLLLEEVAEQRRMLALRISALNHPDER